MLNAVMAARSEKPTIDASLGGGVKLCGEEDEFYKFNNRINGIHKKTPRPQWSGHSVLTPAVSGGGTLGADTSHPFGIECQVAAFSVIELLLCCQSVTPVIISFAEG